MGKFKDYLVKTVKRKEGGIQKLYRFENSYGASVIKTCYSDGGKLGLWELAMIFWKNDEKYNLYYCDIVENGVLGYLNEEDIDPILEKIKNYWETDTKSKEEIMKELLDRYQQLDSLNGSLSAKQVLDLYIKKLEEELVQILRGEDEK